MDRPAGGRRTFAQRTSRLPLRRRREWSASSRTRSLPSTRARWPRALRWGRALGVPTGGTGGVVGGPVNRGHLVLLVIERAGHEEHFDEEHAESARATARARASGRQGYRSRVEAREETSPRTMPSVMTSPFGEVTEEIRTTSSRRENACGGPGTATSGKYRAVAAVRRPRSRPRRGGRPGGIRPRERLTGGPRPVPGPGLRRALTAQPLGSTSPASVSFIKNLRRRCAPHRRRSPFTPPVNPHATCGVYPSLTREHPCHER